MAIDYSELIPNNVNLADDRRLQRALEAWQPHYLDWWREMGPEGFQACDAYLRTATSVDAKGWATFGYLKMPDYRWGIFLAARNPIAASHSASIRASRSGARFRASIAGCCAA